MNIPAISVLMPAYNAEKYISEAIGSILDQTFKDFEFIIVDDASTDGTWNIIKKFAAIDNRIIAIQNERNLKICQTLNRGIEIARGKYILRMDADDWSFPDRIQKQYEYMVSHNEIVISGGTMFVCDEKLNPISKRTYSQHDKELKKSILRYSPFSHPTVIIKTKIVKKVGGYNMLYAEDIELYLKLGQYGKFGNIIEPLIKYRDIPSSMTNTKLKVTELHTLQLRLHAVRKLGYSYTFFDLVYNILQLISVYIFPTKLKIFLFSKFRNKSL